MSTRAVINVFGEARFYKHHDGYPEGVADLLYAAQEYGTGVNLQERMEEVQPSLEELPFNQPLPLDLEYQYMVDHSGSIAMWKKTPTGWKEEYYGPVEGFVHWYRQL